MGIIFQNGFNIADSSLYLFTTFTFTTVNTTGSRGPSLNTLRGAYTGSQTWTSNNAFFSSSKPGFQTWTVPKNGTYEFEVAGARSGRIWQSNITGSRGAIVKGRVQLQQGMKLDMVVGQVSDASGSNRTQSGSYMGLGGGGGSYVATGSTPIFVAGGGGGSARYSAFSSSIIFSGLDGSTNPTGSASRRGALGGTGSMGGTVTNAVGVVSSNAYDGGGGAGFTGDGVNGNNTFTKPYNGGSEGEGGYSFTRAVSASFGGQVGSSWSRPSTYASSDGGFGGGGAGNGIISAGGGGGYSGGGGGWANGTPQSDGGGGGGSFITASATNVATSNGLYDALSNFSGSAITNLSLYNDAPGYIKITFIG